MVTSSGPHFFEVDVTAVGFRFHLVFFSAAFAGRRPVLVRVSGVHANFLTHVSAKAASTALTCEDCGVRFISRLNYKIQAWRHVYDSLCIRLPLALVELEAALKRLRVGNKELSDIVPCHFAAHHAISDGIVYGIWRAVRNGHCPLLLTYYSLFCVVSRAMTPEISARCLRLYYENRPRLKWPRHHTGTPCQ